MVMITIYISKVIISQVLNNSTINTNLLAFIYKN